MFNVHRCLVCGCWVRFESEPRHAAYHLESGYQNPELVCASEYMNELCLSDGSVIRLYYPILRKGGG